MTLVDEVTEQRKRELWALRKMEWSVQEYRLLAQRYVDVAAKMRLAIEDESYQRLKLAFFEMQELNDQTSFLNGGMQNAIEAVHHPERRLK